MRKRSLRLSQVLRPYGPGAIIDLEQESFVMLDTTINAQAWQLSKKIRLPRLEKRLGVSEFRSPPDNSDGYSRSLLVQRFPKWLFCPRCRGMVFWTREREIDLETSKAEMPECKNPKCNNSPLVPMRYVAACKNGHMSDVDWWHWAHSSGTMGQCDKTKKITK